MDEGKKFEVDFENSLSKRSNISYDRLYDTMNGFRGVANICDFIVYARPHQIYFELKSVKDKTFDIGNIKEGKFRSLSRTQYQGMLDKVLIQGVSAGVLLEYRLESTKEDRKHYFIPIECIEYMAEEGKKSINIKDIEYWGGIEIRSTKKRTRYNIDIDHLLTMAMPGEGR